jgi:signal-transduction protein with cAMP-binding, CBS, and nucleotidyltransferase domain
MAAGASLDVPIQQLMSPRPTTLTEHDTVALAIQKMSEGGFRRLPIVSEGNCPLGLLKVSTILHYLVQHFPRYVYNLPPNPHQATQAREGA